MKRVKLYFGLMLFFTASLSFVRFVENFTIRYEACADEWVRETQDAQNTSMFREHMREKIETGQLSANGHKCPQLLPHHKAELTAMLDNQLS